jgi:cytochrome c6
MKTIGIFLLIIFLSVFPLCNPILAENLTLNLAQGEQIFEVHCAGCHPQGGNILRRGKTLKQKALKRYHLENIEDIITLVTNGKNNMSAFGDRLSKEEIENVSAYILEKAAQNWQ